MFLYRMTGKAFFGGILPPCCSRKNKKNVHDDSSKEVITNISHVPTPFGINRWLLLLSYVLVNALTAYLYLGWAKGLQDMLFRSGAFSWLCPPDAVAPADYLPRCKTQQTRVGNLVSVALVSSIVSSVLAGTSLDILGPKITATTGLLINLSGWMLLAESNEYLVGYIPAMGMIGMGCNFSAMSIITVARLFPERRRSIIAIATSAASFSMFVMVTCNAIWKTNIHRITFRGIIWGYVCVASCVALPIVLLLVPWKPFPIPEIITNKKEEERKKIANGENNISEHNNELEDENANEKNHTQDAIDAKKWDEKEEQEEERKLSKRPYITSLDTTAAGENSSVVTGGLSDEHRNNYSNNNNNADISVLPYGYLGRLQHLDEKDRPYETSVSSSNSLHDCSDVFSSSSGRNLPLNIVVVGGDDPNKHHNTKDGGYVEDERITNYSAVENASDGGGGGGGGGICNSSADRGGISSSSQKTTSVCSSSPNNEEHATHTSQFCHPDYADVTAEYRNTKEKQNYLLPPTSSPEEDENDKYAQQGKNNNYSNNDIVIISPIKGSADINKNSSSVSPPSFPASLARVKYGNEVVADPTGYVSVVRTHSKDEKEEEKANDHSATDKNGKAEPLYIYHFADDIQKAAEEKSENSRNSNNGKKINIDEVHVICPSEKMSGEGENERKGGREKEEEDTGSVGKTSFHREKDTSPFSEEKRNNKLQLQSNTEKFDTATSLPTSVKFLPDKLHSKNIYNNNNNIHNTTIKKGRESVMSEGNNQDSSSSLYKYTNDRQNKCCTSCFSKICRTLLCKKRTSKKIYIAENSGDDIERQAIATTNNNNNYNNTINDNEDYVGCSSLSNKLRSTLLHPTFLSTLKEKIYLLAIINFSIALLRSDFLYKTAHGQLGEDVYNVLGYFMPCMCSCTLVLGCIAQKVGPLFGLWIVSTVGTLAYIFAILANSWTRWLALFFLWMHMCFVQTSMYIYLFELFPAMHFGKLMGVAYLLGGLGSLVGIPIYDAAVLHFRGYFEMDLLILGCCAISFCLVSYITYVYVKRKKEAKRRAEIVISTE